MTEECKRCLRCEKTFPRAWFRGRGYCPQCAVDYRDSRRERNHALRLGGHYKSKAVLKRIRVAFRRGKCGYRLPKDCVVPSNTK